MHFKRGYSYLALLALLIGALILEPGLQVVPGLRYEVATDQNLIDNWLLTLLVRPRGLWRQE